MLMAGRFSEIAMRRRIIMAMALVALTAALVRHPTVDVRVITHDITDPAPHRIEAAVDMGLFALKLLVTWTNRRVTAL